VVSVLEGGYDLAALAASVAAHVSALQEAPA
jgi:acetoin utilization deacetylase AcuC-like enzyme